MKDFAKFTDLVNALPPSQRVEPVLLILNSLPATGRVYLQASSCWIHDPTLGPMINAFTDAVNSFLQMRNSAAEITNSGGTRVPAFQLLTSGAMPDLSIPGASKRAKLPTQFNKLQIVVKSHVDGLLPPMAEKALEDLVANAMASTGRSKYTPFLYFNTCEETAPCTHLCDGMPLFFFVGPKMPHA